jgi:SPOR domain/PilZ domain
MSSTDFSAGTGSQADRRVHPRRTSFAYIELGEENGGAILNISESGLAMQTMIQLQDVCLPPMGFQLAESSDWIWTGGRVAWISESKKVAGVEFVNLPKEARSRIREWVDGRTRPHILQKETLDAAPHPQSSGDMPASSAEQAAGLMGSNTLSTDTAPWQRVQLQAALREDSARKWPRVTPLVLLAVLLVAAGAHERGVFHQASRGIYKKFFTNYIAATTEKGTPPASASSSPATTEGSPAGKAAASADLSRVMASLDRPGLVLQVGAMRHEEYADALVGVLQRKNFPAFEIRRRTDRFYRVVVGPYADTKSAVQAEKDLEKAGFETVIEHWTPE